MTPAAAFRAARAGRDKSQYYREWHLRQRAGLPYPALPSPHSPLPFEVALVALGKESGKLEEALRLLADYFMAEDKAVLAVLKQATYPMITALAAAFIAPIPLLARGDSRGYLIALVVALAIWYAAAGGLLLGAIHRHLARPRFVLGRLLRALTIAVEAGLPLGRAAELAAAASGSPEIVAHVRRVGGRTAAQPLAVTFRGCPHVPFTALAAMEVADATGDYGMTLRKLADLTE